MTAMHEVIGHGSGKLSPQLTHEAALLSQGIFLHARRSARRSDGAVERFRSEAQGTGHRFRPTMSASVMYNSAARVTADAAAPDSQGDTIEEDHQRNRQLIANYIMDKTGAIAWRSPQRQDLRRGERLREDAPGRGHAAGRAHADQGRGRLRRDQQTDRPVWRSISIRSFATKWSRGIRG